MLLMIQSSCGTTLLHQPLHGILALLLTQPIQIHLMFNTIFYPSANHPRIRYHIGQMLVQAPQRLPVLIPAYTDYVSS